MKIYMFFLIRKEIDTHKYPGVAADNVMIRDNYEYALYAYTPSKKIANIFSNTRKRKLFYKKTVRMSRDEYEDFTRDNGGTLLGYHSLKTKVLVEDEYTRRYVDVLMTGVESDYCIFDADGYVLNQFYDIVDFNEAALKKNIQLALHECFEFDVVSDIINCALDEEAISSYFDVDNVSVYIKLFGNTYNNKGGEYDVILK